MRGASLLPFPDLCRSVEEHIERRYRIRVVTRHIPDPLIGDLKRRNFITWVDFSDKEVCSPDFEKKVLTAFKKTLPLILFLNKAMGLKN